MSASSTKSAACAAFACAAVATAACGSDEAPKAGAAQCDGVELLVAASDYSSSVVCGAPRCEATGITSPDLGHDPALAVSNGRAFFIARDNARIFELDPTCGTPIARYSVYDETKQGSPNPHDVALASDGSMFVVLWNVPRIAVLENGQLAGPGIDLSTFDPDGNPQAESIRIVMVDGHEKAFVTLQRLDDKSTPVFASTRTSQMLRIDIATRTVDQAIELAGQNPFNVMAEHDGLLFLAEPGDFDSATDVRAGIERFDTATSTSRLLATEMDLGGSVAEVAVTYACGVAIVAGARSGVNPTSLVTFDPVTGKVLTTAQAPVLGPTPGYDLQGLAWRGNTLFVGDRRPGGAGYRVHAFEREPGTCILRGAPAREFDLPQRPVALRAAAAR